MIYSYENKKPDINLSVFVAQSADIIGDVKIGQDSSIWFGVVIRGDSNYIKIGSGSNIQDNSVIHVNSNDNGVTIEDNVTVGHGVILHGCTVHSNCLIGMGSTIMDNAEIGEGSIVGANSLVTSGKKIPSGVLCMGSPAKVIRKLTEEEKLSIKENAKHYIEMGKKYL
ncbi:MULTISPECIES: gamma carbonic anhydrase family protein [Clostridium]|uniref:gamma carbonic anhydrase family protein n=1 Tax=Clostridium TaxID=1485 RepID=UPI0008255C8B|nr:MULTISPECIES: gamma carbonic anhydrase family protein [Clostridium]PJI07204.1 gamma carbonic anhydrase family protein [Clostridium sp. CT7]